MQNNHVEIRCRIEKELDPSPTHAIFTAIYETPTGESMRFTVAVPLSTAARLRTIYAGTSSVFIEGFLDATLVVAETVVAYFHDNGTDEEVAVQL